MEVANALQPFVTWPQLIFVLSDSAEHKSRDAGFTLININHVYPVDCHFLWTEKYANWIVQKLLLWGLKLGGHATFRLFSQGSGWAVIMRGLFPRSLAYRRFFWGRWSTHGQGKLSPPHLCLLFYLLFLFVIKKLIKSGCKYLLPPLHHHHPLIPRLHCLLFCILILFFFSSVLIRASSIPSSLVFILNFSYARRLSSSYSSASPPSLIDEFAGIEKIGLVCKTSPHALVTQIHRKQNRCSSRKTHLLSAADRRASPNSWTPVYLLSWNNSNCYWQ